ncbi:probable 2-oxoglutarate-dependent dioxygenase ANS [Chenopodium quinoa]|uniref:probable 2-oxoglutarate-dependent dioxygenase ANS n=1 Tax=Chenopodium quinoa TaxID=63459 RepID=UPI000B7799AB|nr:probable 2-oxoglutarate-dependent dioxygenase ANS [Chenopodium quinoa]
MEVTGESPTQVQTLSQTKTLPPQYIQPPQLRPTNHHKPPSSTPTIPLIDLSLSSQTLLPQLSSACRYWGAFHLLNHGIPINLLDQMRTVGSSFFEDLDVSEKLKYGCDQSSAASGGYGSRMLVSGNDDTVLDWRDYFDHHTFPLSRRDPSRWPIHPPNYRNVVEEYSEQMKLLAQKLMALISESLGLPSSCIEDAVGEFYQNITVSYYPSCPQPELTLGLQAHSDMGAVTLLIQDDVGGLEVFKDGEWVIVQPLSDAIVVILADQTEVITNGEYKSSVHRAVTNSNRARLSVATFHDPAKTRRISPAPELVAKSGPRYKEVLYGDFVKSWYTKGPEGKRNLDALLL